MYVEKSKKNVKKSQEQLRLKEVWRHIQSLAQESMGTESCSDEVLLWHIAQKLHLVEILDKAAEKRKQGLSAGLITVLMAIHRAIEPGSSKNSFLDWYSSTDLPKITGLPAENIKYQNLGRSLKYWCEDQVIRTIEIKIFSKLWSELRYRPRELIWYPTSIFKAVPNNLPNSRYKRRQQIPLVSLDLMLDAKNSLPIYCRSHQSGDSYDARFRKAVGFLSKIYIHNRPMIVGDSDQVKLDTIKYIRGRGYDSVFHFDGIIARKRYLKANEMQQLLQEDQRIRGVINMIKTPISEFKEKGFYFDGHIKFRYKGFYIKKEKVDKGKSFLYIFQNRKRLDEEFRNIKRQTKACISELKSIEPERYDTPKAIEKRAEYIMNKHKVGGFFKSYVNVTGNEIYIKDSKSMLNHQSRISGRKIMLISLRKNKRLNSMTPKKLYRLYHSCKHPILPVFTSIFTHKETHIKSHIFVCQLGSILKCMLNRMESLE